MNILEIENLTKTYATGHKALDGLTLSVRRGAVFGFIGLNGAGKTTTIRIVAGLTRKESGSVRFAGADLGADGPAYKRRIGFVLDEPLYFGWMTGHEYLRFVGMMYGLAPGIAIGRAEELLEFFDLVGRSSERIETYSTGMKKKVSLAAAIIHRPELVLLDEPLEGIDAVAGASIREALLHMASRGTTVFLTSHVLDTVQRLCSEVAIVHEGRTLLQCATQEIGSRTMSALGEKRHGSLEELFVNLVARRVHSKHLSWL